jgi:histidyl-tRNA synthetase
MSKVLPAKGFRDFTPGLKRRKEELLATIRACYLRYGFDEIETPVAEPIERLRGSEGGENLAMIFEILRRGLTPEDLRAAQSPADLVDLGLRYDLTVPLARYYATNQAELPPVFRAIQIGPVWRAEKPQKGRFRQFTQCDIDILGEPSALAEIELIVATLEALRAIGLSDATVRINDRRILDALLTESGVPGEGKAKALILIDKLDKVGREEVVASLAESFPDGAGAKLGEALFGAARPEAQGEIADIIAAVRAVAGEASITFDPTLVRGLGYYTGPIFEVRHPASRGSVGGGGRYDNMIGKFLGQPVPASGFSLGFDRLLEIIADLPASSAASADRIGLIYEETDAPAAVIARQPELLARGLSVRLVKSARNKQRMFDELLRAGYGRVQRMADEASAFRELGGQS